MTFYLLSVGQVLEFGVAVGTLVTSLLLTGAGHFRAEVPAKILIKTH